MSRIRTKCTLILAGFLLAAGAAPQTLAQSLNAVVSPNTLYSKIGILPPDPMPPPPGIKPQPQPAVDSSVYTSYTAYGADTSILWLVCGSIQSITGCFGSGTLGPFGKIGAMIEGSPSTNGATGAVTRNIYVLDEATNGGTGVTLYVYKKTDVIGSATDTVSMTLTNTITLPLLGGMQAITSMAANNNLLYIGTNQGGNFVQINKSGLIFKSLTGPSATVSSITADQYGYVTVTGGTNIETAGFSVYGPSGLFVEDGGGGDFVLDTTNGISIGNNSNVISSIATPNTATRMQIHFKQTPP